jgi:quercetin dioxygenase-like cupin family protein
MKLNRSFSNACKGMFFILMVVLQLMVFHTSFAQVTDKQEQYPQPKVITFYPDSAQYQCLFDGEKDTVVFHSGVVTLAPKQTVGSHNTESYEEMIIVLQGRGRLELADRRRFDIAYGKIAFCPPFTEHNVVNTGDKDLKYIYVATKAR